MDMTLKLLVYKWNQGVLYHSCDTSFVPMDALFTHDGFQKQPTFLKVTPPLKFTCHRNVR